jgi:hypothetical protein
MAKTGAIHEDYARQAPAKLGSDRAFGQVFAGVFAIFALLPLLHAGAPRWWALIAAAGFLLAALTVPHLLRPLNRAWGMVGLILQHVVGNAVIALLFYAVLTPVGLLQRRLGKNPVTASFDPQRTTYWEPRIAPAPQAMRRQF